MEEEGDKHLRELGQRSIQSAQLAVLDAQAEALDDRRGVALQYRDYPAGWSLGVHLPPSRELREQAHRLLTGRRSPLRRALRRLHQSESEHDRRFLELLWEDRPELVAAVAVYSELKGAKLHPDRYRRRVVGRRFFAAVATLAANREEGRIVQGVEEALRDYPEARRESERLDTLLLQLELLGWGRWRVPEGELEPSAGPGHGGGEPMPSWTLSVAPDEVDGSQPADLGTWWRVEATEAPPNEGRSLWTHTVAATIEALGLSGVRNDRDLREPVARHLPDVFSARRDPSPGGPIKHAVDNLRR